MSRPCPTLSCIRPNIATLTEMSKPKPTELPEEGYSLEMHILSIDFLLTKRVYRVNSRPKVDIFNRPPKSRLAG